MSVTFSALDVSHKFLAEHVKPGDFCIDATAGRGGDAAFLCSLTGKEGRVLAFDIQQEAVDSTNALLAERGFAETGRAILESHANMASYAAPESVSAITFNFGWLPGGDHNINTRAASSIAAIKAGLTLLKPMGVMSLCIYYGRNTGYEERDALLDYFKTIDDKLYTVLVAQFYNRPHNPPIPVFIVKDS